MTPLLRDTRVQRLLIANTLGSIGSGITIFAIPWLMVKAPGGNVAFRHITLITTLVIFLFMPAYGAAVDRRSRKALLLGSEAFGFLATTAMAVTGLVLGHFAMWQLMTIYFCGMFYYTLHYPVKFAFLQQTFERAQYGRLMGLVEVQGQAAMMIAGGLGGWLVERVPLWLILLLDAATYLASFLIQATLPYRATHLENRAPADLHPGVYRSLAEGWRWLRTRPRLNVFLLCAFMPFVAVMVGNYLFPIYVAQTLHAGAVWFAGGEIAFALGAIAAGALLPRVLARTRADTTIPVTIFIFLLGLLALITLHHPLLFLAAAVLLGFGNAGSRVARSSLMLEIVPNEMMGRVGVFYHVLDRLLRTLLVSAMAVTDLYGPPAGYLLLFALVLLAWIGVLQTRSAVHASAVPNSSPA